MGEKAGGGPQAAVGHSLVAGWKCLVLGPGWEDALLFAQVLVQRPGHDFREEIRCSVLAK